MIKKVITSKKDFLSKLTALASQGEITQTELMQAFEKGCHQQLDSKVFDKNKITMVQWLTFLGAGVAGLGMILLVWQYWGSLTAVFKLCVSFGSGLAAYLLGTYFSGEKKFHQLGTLFFALSLILIYIGLNFSLDQYKIRYLENFTITNLDFIVPFILLLVSVFSYKRWPEKLFIFTGIFFATHLFYDAALYLIDKHYLYHYFSNYCLLICGLFYMGLGVYFKADKNKDLSSILKISGLILFLSAVFSLCGYRPYQNIFWEILFPILLLAIIAGSIYLKRKSFLNCSVFFLILYFFKITHEYFSQYLSWPLGLIVSGIILLLISGYCVTARKK